MRRFLNHRYNKVLLITLKFYSSVERILLFPGLLTHLLFVFELNFSFITKSII